MDRSGSPPSAVEELVEFVAPDILARLEQRYWDPIGHATLAEVFLADEEFYANPGEHPGTFSDHGVVHVRDVATRAARLVLQLDGGLLVARDPERRRFVQGCAVLMAYLHDIGMVAATPAGRRVHAQFAAQTALDDQFDDIAHDLWATDAAGLRTRIGRDLGDGRGRVHGRSLLREVLAMSLCHSKSAVPAPMLDDPEALRRLMLRATFTALDAQVGRPREALWTEPRDTHAASAAVGRYDDVERDAFTWLIDDQPAARCFATDVVDAVRVLRAADALRQRGTTQRTSAGYEVCVDRRSGHAVVALRSTDDRFAALLWTENRLSIAEANLRVVDLTVDGSLRMAFHRGSFGDPGAVARVVRATAHVVADIEADALGSFTAQPGGPGAARLVELEAPADDPRFADLVRDHLVEEHPHLSGRTVVVADERSTPRPEEASWLARATLVDGDGPSVPTWFTALARHGLNVDAIDKVAALHGVRRVRLQRGEQVLAPGTEASVVVISLGPGLRVAPIGGYGDQLLHAWLPIGVTGVARGAERNAAVVAEAEVEVLVISAERYLAEWFRPYTAVELRVAWAAWRAAEAAR